MLDPEGNLDRYLKVSEETKRYQVESDVIAYATIITGLSKGMG